MSKHNNNFPVNWIDGMVINKQHFIQTESAVIERMDRSNARFLSPINYGLLTGYPDTEPSLVTEVSIDGQSTVHVNLSRCLAVTRSGAEIYITSEVAKMLDRRGQMLSKECDLESEQGPWDIVLSVDPYQRVAAGDADSGEVPPRQPYALPKFEIHVVAESEVGDTGMGAHYLTIGKIRIKDGKPFVDKDFIPPCTSIQSHEDLKFIYGEIGSFFNQLESYSLHIIQKIHQKKQANELANMTLALTERTMQCINGLLPQFRLNDRYSPPSVMISRVMTLARVIKSGLDRSVGTGKEDYLNYLTDWCDLNQGAFEQVLVDMIELEYDHRDINNCLTTTSVFTKLMLGLFKKLNELDYIGKKDDPGLFVKEEVEEQKEIKSRRSFLLD